MKFETKFRLENLTNLKFLYSLMDGKNNQGKNKGVLNQKKSLNFNFEENDTLYIK